MVILFDIGNTHTHVGLFRGGRITRQLDLATDEWLAGKAGKELARWAGAVKPRGGALCSVVPQATPLVMDFASRSWGWWPLELTVNNVVGVGVDYLSPETIGPDRLANAIAAKARYGAPVLVLDFGTAVTLDVVNPKGDYAGGVIAPGLSAMTDYLHEKTALLPKIRIRDVDRAIGRSTEEAMLIGAVHGYRGLIRQLISEVKNELRARILPVVATGGCAALLAQGVPEISEVDPVLTLDGLRRFWLASPEGRPGTLRHDV